MRPQVSVLALDLGVHMGWCVLRRGDPLLRVGTEVRRLGSGVWHIGDDPSLRLARLRTHLRKLVPRVGAEVVAYEEVRAHKGTHAAHVYGELLGVVRLTCRDLGLPPPVGVAVAQGKRALGGSGRASKADQVRQAKALLGRDPETHDEADALGVALAVLQMWPAV